VVSGKRSRRPPQAPEHTEPGPVARVFLVEDFQGTRDLLLDLFSSTGRFQVVGTAGTEAEAKLWLEDFLDKWDLVVTDLVLAEGSGMEVVSRAKALKPEARVVVLSAYATEGIRKHCLNLGAEAVFDKGRTEEFVHWLDAVQPTAGDA
jgi:two-component system OmpR family response regulator